MANTHAYRGLVAEAYDLHQPPYQDEDFYRERIEAAGGAALEIGSGTGRLLIPYREAGLDIEGVDPSDEMIAICREKTDAAGLKITIHQQYAQELSLERRYRTIYIPVSSFQLIEDLDDASSALQRFREHLEPGGQLLVSLYLPHEELDANNEWRLGRHMKRDDGGTILISHATRSYRERQLLKTTSKYELFDKDGLLLRTELHASSLRWYLARQFAEMLETAGYREIASTGDLSDDPLSDGHRLMMFRALA